MNFAKSKSANKKQASKQLFQRTINLNTHFYNFIIMQSESCIITGLYGILGASAIKPDISY